MRASEEERVKKNKIREKKNYRKKNEKCNGTHTEDLYLSKCGKAKKYTYK